MSTIRLTIALLTVCLVLGPGALADYDAGTNSPLSFGVGSRELSLGGASRARCDLATAPFWNPARLAEAEQMTFTGFHTQLFDSDVSYQYIGFAYPTLDFGTFGFGVQRLGIDNIEERDDQNMLTGSFSDSRLGFLLAYGRYWGEYQIGLTVGIEHHSLAAYSATASPEINLSAARGFGSPTGWLGDIDLLLAVRNLAGSSIELDQESITRPSTWETSASFDLFPDMSEQHSLEFSTALAQTNGIDPQLSIGMEYFYSNLFALRTGLREQHWSAGFGLNLKPFSFDYGMLNRELGTLHTFGITTNFGASTSEKRFLRDKQREAEFESRMHDQLTKNNQAAVNELITKGGEAMDSGLLTEARDRYERALFVSRSSGLDTTDVARLLHEVSQQLAQQETMEQHDLCLDSAQYYLANDNLINARYFCDLATQALPASADAKELGEIINSSLRETEARATMIDEQAGQIDSLLAYGQFEEAVDRAESLEKISPDNEAVDRLLKRARFENLRHQGEQAYAMAEYDLAEQIVAKSEQLFPNHQWSSALRNKLSRARKSKTAQAPPVAQSKPAELTETARKHVQQLYQAGQAALESGALEEAITNWEQVILLAPNYQSVRDYLVQAYKYIGVEHYSNNRLERALAMWRRASELVPKNQEIATYISRTEAELEKIRELSYEQ